MSEELKRLQTFIPAETLKKVKIVAAECGITVAYAVDQLLKDAIESYIQRKSSNGDE